MKLLHLVMIVKDAGPGFRKFILANKSYIDSWTILDTGSTDGTQDIIRSELYDIPGILYEEPFINFQDSRNRAFELADLHNIKCTYYIVLDDSYEINGDLRNYISQFKDDVNYRTFSIRITSKQSAYYSCRITRADLNIRYKNKVHEYINDSKPSYNIPDNIYVYDVESEYGKERTQNRLSRDLKHLMEDKDTSRNKFYIAQTYSTMKDWINSAIWYKKRIADKGGFDEEIYNSKFRLGLIYEIHLGKKWCKCYDMYMSAYNDRPHRAEPLILIADYYYRNNNYEAAFMYAKRAFEIPFPVNEGLFVEKKYYDFDIPDLLIKLCYSIGEYQTGLEASLKLNSEWINIYRSCLQYKSIECDSVDLQSTEYDKPILCIVTAGNFYPWNGNTPNTKGLGGSETSAVRFGEELSKWYTVFIFCNCSSEETINNVRYKSNKKYINFIGTHKVDTCIVLRYNNYLPVSYLAVKNVYLWLQDILPVSSNLVVNYSKLKGIFVLSEWHKQVFLNHYHWVNKNIVYKTTNAVDLDKFPITKKIPYSFIYSSFPDRGLIHLVRMFPRIVSLFPDAHLNVFCNLDLKVLDKKLMDEIKALIKSCDNIILHGWVDKNTLRKYWASSEIWLYPCTFAETSCITALEAAASRTIPITNDLGALKEHAVNGIVIPGDITKEWENTAIDKIASLYNDREKMSNIVSNNYSWVLKRTYDKVAASWPMR